MLSFKVLNVDNTEEIIIGLSDDESVREELREIVADMELDDPDMEFALSYAHGCALIRVYDMGRHSFIYPLELYCCDDRDTGAALDAIAEYAMRQEVPFNVDNVPRERLSDFASFRHFDVDARDPEGETFRVRVKTECDLIRHIPEVEEGRVKLNELCEDDIPEYARLVRDRDVNKHWGYDYSEDVDDPDDEYFYDIALSELESGIALSMAIRSEGNFIGEVILYAFDGRGCAEFAIRLLPEWQGKGLGTEAVRALTEASREIGLVRLSSRIMKENKASVRMLDKVADERFEEGDQVIFYIDLYDLG